MSLSQSEPTLQNAAAKAGMDVKTARKYRKAGCSPSQMLKPHVWRTRANPFAHDWLWVTDQLEINPGLEAKTLFFALQGRKPGIYHDGQLRTFQRHLKIWRALEGPAKEVYFEQIHLPGQWGASDFTHMNSLGITICGSPFEHMLYHFVLTYSNWETVTICYSETFESLSEGVQNALWKLGGVPEKHKTDRLSAAWSNLKSAQDYTQRYTALANHYGFTASKTNPRCPHENGDVEQANNRLKKAVEQALMLRQSKDFSSIDQYKAFLGKIIDQLNSNRQERFKEELAVLGRLPLSRLDAFKKYEMKVTQGSTIRVRHNVYSVHSRMVGEKVKVNVYGDHIEVWYAQRQIETLPLLQGNNKAYINYRHVIDILVRKPGAFEQYRYRDSLYPTIQFRLAYDRLRTQHSPLKANKQYLEILRLAARGSQDRVNDALCHLIDSQEDITPEAVKTLVEASAFKRVVRLPEIAALDLDCYDQLLEVYLEGSI